MKKRIFTSVKAIKTVCLTATLLFINATSIFAQYTKLLDFEGTSNGSSPYFGELYSDGTFLYGMTLYGGINNLGTVFKMLHDGTGYTKLLDFAGVTNGSNPNGSLIFDGTFLFGMTTYGGANDFGTVFKILPDGTGYMKLLDFYGATNAKNPFGTLIYDGTFLYGMTHGGGATGSGTVFKILPDGTGYTQLLDFNGSNNGSFPYGSLIYDGAFFYGMTESGGINNAGTIFKILPDGTGYIKLLDFAGATNGSNPFGSLISDGIYIYGMTNGGGTNNAGTVFKILPDGTSYIKLLDFAGITNGLAPYGSLISDGTFIYGMTSGGGANSVGTLFKILPDGTGYTNLLDFAGTTNGSYPHGSLFYYGTSIYGLTTSGGINDIGTVFKLNITNVGISPLSLGGELLRIYPNPTSGMVNINISNQNLVRIKIYNLTGELLQEYFTTDFSIVNFPSGIYFITTQTDKSTFINKLIKE